MNFAISMSHGPSIHTGDTCQISSGGSREGSLGSGGFARTPLGYQIISISWGLQTGWERWVFEISTKLSIIRLGTSMEISELSSARYLAPTLILKLT